MLNKCNPYHDKGIMTDNIPHLRKEKPTFLALSTIPLMLLMATTPLLFFNLVPVLAQQPNVSFRTPVPANGTEPGTGENGTLTFDAQGTPRNPHVVDITSGAFQVTSLVSGQTLYSDPIWRVQGCCLTNDSSGESITILAGPQYGETEFTISTSCSTSATNQISLDNTDGSIDFTFQGPVECSSSQGGGNTTAQQSSSPSSMTGTTAQDSDGDGIPDTSDRCANNPNPRCFKEGR